MKSFAATLFFIAQAYATSTEVSTEATIGATAEIEGALLSNKRYGGYGLNRNLGYGYGNLGYRNKGLKLDTDTSIDSCSSDCISVSAASYSPGSYSAGSLSKSCDPWGCSLSRSAGSYSAGSYSPASLSIETDSSSSSDGIYGLHYPSDSLSSSDSYFSSDYSDSDHGYGYRQRKALGGVNKFYRYRPVYNGNRYYYGRNYASLNGTYKAPYNTYGYRSVGLGRKLGYSARNNYY